MSQPASTRGAASPRHSAVVRFTHWLTVLAFVALLVSGLEILISHPRFYWGEVGNVMTRPLFTIPIPSSRDTVPTAYKYVMPDQNGWSRYLHFQAAWLVLFAGVLCFAASLWNGHFRRDLLPPADQRNWRAYRSVASRYLHRAPAPQDESRSYNVMQRTAYAAVIFILFPLMIWTGLAMSPAFTAVAPWAVEALGGRQSARTLHFFVTDALVLFFFTHIAMVYMAGFRSRMRAMITGNSSTEGERE